MKPNISAFLLMYLSFFIYSLSGVFLKIASYNEILSFKYILLFGMVVLIMGIYAILWQQVLKRIDLSVAMANKPVVLIIGVIIACCFFGEKLNTSIVIGCLLIIIGILIIGFKNE